MAPGGPRWFVLAFLCLLFCACFCYCFCLCLCFCFSFCFGFDSVFVFAIAIAIDIYICIRTRAGCCMLSSRQRQHAATRCADTTGGDVACRCTRSACCQASCSCLLCERARQETRQNNVPRCQLLAGWHGDTISHQGGGRVFHSRSTHHA